MMVQDKMTQDKNDKLYRTLEFYKETKKKIHIKIIHGQDKGLFRNGYILDVSKSKRVFIFIDDVMGELPYLFEEVDHKIKPFREKK